MHGNPTQRLGFTLVEMMIVIAIVGVLAAIAVPNYLRYSTESRKNTCINNLKQIHLAIQEWAIEQKKGPSSTVEFNDIRPFLKDSLSCPSGGRAFTDSYSISTVAAEAACLRSPETHVWMAGPLEVAGKGSGK
jgi:prepilin-type N-terminal cleavage/methylation domain-containing protein